jgi:hypothetical protein
MHLQKRQIQFVCILTVPLIAIVHTRTPEREERGEGSEERGTRAGIHAHTPNKHDKGGRGSAFWDIYLAYQVECT